MDTLGCRGSAPASRAIRCSSRHVARRAEAVVLDTTRESGVLRVVQSAWGTLSVPRSRRSPSPCGFTTISESLDPQNLSAYINEYLTTMSLVIRNNRGTLDKYIGDAIMAFWGAPVADPSHHRNGVMTAIQMQQKAVELNEEFRKRGWPEFRIGIGLNSGVMSVGDMGSKVRKAYTVMGDPVNLGSRLEGITKQYGVGILVGETTKKGVPDVVFREIDRVRVKGKDEPVAIFEPIGIDGQVDKAVLDELKLWHQVLRLYRAQDWDKAELQLMNLQRMNPGCELYRIFSEKINDYRANPPGSAWDGVTKFETK